MVVVPRTNDRFSASRDCLSVVLVDRRPLFLAALAAVIQDVCSPSSIEVFTESDGALELASKHSVDLLFCEVQAVPLAGAEVAAQLCRLGSKTRVILLGAEEDQDLIISSLGCGAAGFFSKAASPEEFVQGLDAVLAGHFVITRDLAPITLARLGRTRSAQLKQPLGQLSETERSILLMLAQAQSTRAIAASRGISPKTVRNHLASIYRKLAVRNRSEAIVWSARVGLVPHLPATNVW